MLHCLKHQLLGCICDVPQDIPLIRSETKDCSLFRAPSNRTRMDKVEYLGVVVMLIDRERAVADQFLNTSGK